MKNIEATIEIITPDRAKQIWERRNFENRKISGIMLERFASDMAAGRWQMNGQGIVFDCDGRLVDGHHRISACIRANSPFTTLVTRGIEPDAVDVIDSGHSRSIGHVVQMRGVQNAHAVCSGARLVMAYQRLSPGTLSMESHDNYSHLDVLNFIEQNPRIIESARIGRSLKRIVRASVAGCLHFILSEADKSNADWFFEQLATGSNLEADHPALALRNRLIVLRTTKAKVSDFELLQIGIRAWNHFVCGRSIKTLIFQKGNSLPPVVGPGDYGNHNRWTVS